MRTVTLMAVAVMAMAVGVSAISHTDSQADVRPQTGDLVCVAHARAKIAQDRASAATTQVRIGAQRRASAFSRCFPCWQMDKGSFYQAFVASFLMILVAEIGDRTFFIAAIMAMKQYDSSLEWFGFAFILPLSVRSPLSLSFRPSADRVCSSFLLHSLR